jgi:cellulose biosynthesis protein BcsQ
LDNNIKGILVNKFNYSSSISKEFIEYCQEEEDVGQLLFKNHIPLDEKVLEAELERKPINIYDRESRVFEEYNSFVDELITRLQ